MSAPSYARLSEGAIAKTLHSADDAVLVDIAADGTVLGIEFPFGRGVLGSTHGRASTYRHGCRCGDCTRASTEKARGERVGRVERLKRDPSLAAHGKTSTYTNWGCRCDECRAAHSADMAERSKSRSAS